MAQNLTPELYLWLLSGRHGDMSHIPTRQRNNDGSRLSGPFPNDPDRIIDLLDALAALCVQKEKGQVFFVSLAMQSDAVTLYVSSNETVPDTVSSHLHTIWSQLKGLHAVLKFDPSIPADSESSPDPNTTQSRKDCELALQMTIYQYSYKKVRQHFLKTGPTILAQYHNIMTSLQNKSARDAHLLASTQRSLQRIGSWLQNERPPGDSDLTVLISIIDLLSRAWSDGLKAVEGGDILTRWDNSLHVGQSRILSLRRLLQKLFTLHHHIRTITHIAWSPSRRLSTFLKGQFDVISVPAACGDISTRFSKLDILPIIFPPGKPAESNVKTMVYDTLLERLQVKPDKEGVNMKKGAVPQLSMKVNVLLAYHLQRYPQINPYNYFGGSKHSCHGCSTLFSSFNVTAESFNLSQFFTKGCHSKIYLRWPCPSLLSQEQQKRLRPGDRSLDTQVRKEMVTVLSAELATYVDELRVAAEAPSRPQSDSTAASDSSRSSGEEALEMLDATLEAVFAFRV